MGDLQGGEYLFRDCHSTYTLAVAHANFFKGGELRLPVCIRRRGRWVNVTIYQIDVKTAECPTCEKIVIDRFLSPEFLGERPRERMFGGVVGFIKAGNTTILPSVITMKNDGTIEIYPCDQEGKFFFETFHENDNLTAVSIEFAYIVDDEQNAGQTLKLMNALQKENHLSPDERTALTQV